MSVFNFFVRFSRVEPCPLISRVCVARRSRINIWFSRFSVFLDPYFRRFYDFFLRRKHLESLVRVIRPFGVHMCATRAKNFRLDIFVRRIIMKIERDAAVSAVSPHTSNSRTMLTAWVAARRSTRFWGYVDHDRKDHDKAYRETQGSRPAPVSHLHHPLSQGSG